MNKQFSCYLIVLSSIYLPNSIAFQNLGAKRVSEKKVAETTVEETRVSKAASVIPKVVSLLDQHSKTFQSQWQQSQSFEQAKVLVLNSGNQLWNNAKTKIRQTESFDDRSLYWQRLKISRIIRSIKPQFSCNQKQLSELLNILEQSSRGINNIHFDQPANKKILLTGFDPFLLDRNINQSNPSGVVALLLDGLVIEKDGISAQINTFVAPVRYRDFDQGLIETTLSPYYLLNNLNMITTVSMGRKDFDLERFPGKRRSVTAPDNLNILSGGTSKSPVISKLGNQQLPGPEFVEFSLPVSKMKSARGKYKINDNHQVTTTQKTFEPTSLSELKNAIAVSGSGGGYLSNEISYRSIRLRNQIGSQIPTGHIHTPRIQKYDPEATKAIVEQIVEMLKLSLTEI
ncbi:hypothetical protein [Aliikangiella coralliicola]|uniref:Pyrrolidone-carboxylate peptidase n=1 Tax=Aliikangiella coralliicola TaxID=2592383 RepID=A0A545U4X0_9GAMM|nr:hypothetical protein [Aliikangiella coralliicola]TQV84453.1 hypothetical protein FLL46_22820 [Aliikangiella coralliicola]